jgi:hypothetical protein
LKSGGKLNLIDIVVPGVCGPLPDLQGLKLNSTLSALAKLLARADKQQSEEKGFYPELAALFSSKIPDPVPSAALSLLGENQELGEGLWFHADPVNLQIDMDRAILRDCASLDLEADEAAVLINEANDHFSGDGIRLIATDENHWYLNVDGHSDIETTALHDVIGCNVNFFLPKGGDEKYWQRFLNEAQMLFHMSSVNKKREESGQLPVNSLWLWGGGKLPETVTPSRKYVYANHALAKGLAAFHNAEHHHIDDIETLFDMIDKNLSLLVVLDDVFIPACYGDTVAWQQALDELFEQWVEPLVSYSLDRKINVRLHPCNGANYLVSPSNKYRLFRRSNIRDHVTTYE